MRSDAPRSDSARSIPLRPINSRWGASAASSTSVRASACGFGTWTRPPTCNRSFVIPRKFCMAGPTMTGRPNSTGSSTLWPPQPLRDPPTNTISARRYTAASSPRLSSSTTIGRRGASEVLIAERRTTGRPDAAKARAASSNRSGCRGATTARNPLTLSARLRNAGASIASSLSRVLPAIISRSGAACSSHSRRSAGIVRLGSDGLKSYLRLPTVSVCSGMAPAFTNRCRSASD